MEETRIMPDDLKIGDRYRLTGDACNPEEAADKRIFEVIDLDRRVATFEGKEVLVGLSALVRCEPKPAPLRIVHIGPWVPLIRLSEV